MSFLKNLPPLSLSFLFVTYTLLGWIIAEVTPLWRDWILAHFCSALFMVRSGLCEFLMTPYVLWASISIPIVLVALALIHPITEIKSVFGNWLQSDAKAFLSVIAIAFFSVVFLTRSDLLAEGIILLAPGLLTRLELQLAGYSEWQAFAIIAFVCLFGYALGLLVHQIWEL